MFCKITYPDKSVVIVETLEREILESKFNIMVSESEIYNIITKRMVAIPEDGSVSYSIGYPGLEGVEYFANRII